MPILIYSSRAIAERGMFSARVADKAEPSPINPPGQREALLEAVDKGLLVPGELVRTTIYARIESSYKVRREDIPEKLETFDKALQELLGAGAKVMEKIIVRNLYNSLGLNLTMHANWMLADYVNHVKKTPVSDQEDSD